MHETSTAILYEAHSFTTTWKSQWGNNHFACKAEGNGLGKQIGCGPIVKIERAIGARSKKLKTQQKTRNNYDQSRTEGDRDTKKPSKKSINPRAGFLKRSTKQTTSQIDKKEKRE